MATRARTAWDKFTVVYDLYRAWLRAPDLRLGQLIVNATRGRVGPLFYLEDGPLAEDLVAFALPKEDPHA